MEKLKITGNEIHNKKINLYILYNILQLIKRLLKVDEHISQTELKEVTSI